MKQSAIIFLFFLPVLMLLVIFFFWQKKFGPPLGKTRVSIGSEYFDVDIADTLASRMQGLSARDSLSQHSGMLFVFQSPGSYGFWMKDMKFPIDIVWINGDKISGFSENLQPEPGKSIFSLPIYYPPEPIDKVLEINAGLVEKYNFQEGESMKIIL